MRSLPRTIGSLLLGLALSSSLFACSSFSPDEPPLPDTTMVEMLTELHLAQARARIHEDSVFVPLRDSILLHYGVSQTRFERALRYYSDHPSAYLPIQSAVEDSLEMGRRQLLED